MFRILGFSTTIALTIATVYGIFWRFAPWITSTIPDGAWHNFAAALVYVAIGLLGGVELPLVILYVGLVVTYLFTKD